MFFDNKHSQTFFPNTKQKFWWVFDTKSRSKSNNTKLNETKKLRFMFIFCFLFPNIWGKGGNCFWFVWIHDFVQNFPYDSSYLDTICFVTSWFVTLCLVTPFSKESPNDDNQLGVIKWKFWRRSRIELMSNYFDATFA